VDLVLPVPLSAQRLQQRGFNQAWELTRRLARLFGLQAEAHLLQRPVDTAHQVELSLQDRARNLQGAFMVDPKARSNLLGRRVALVESIEIDSTGLDGVRLLLIADPLRDTLT
jgi:predicted amidophosphoribosyltransferase